MIEKESLVGYFRNIIPATFEDTLTYLEQLKVLQEVLNETVDVVNQIVNSGGSGFILEPATSEKLGGVKIGEGVNVDSEGTISVDIPEIPDIPEYEPYELPIATTETLGGVKDSRAEAVSIAGDGTIFLKANTDSFELKPGNIYGNWLNLKSATADTLGGVKIGEGITISEDGKISVVIPEVSIELGQGLKLVDGKITLDLGQNLYFTEDGKVNAIANEPTVITTGIQDSVNTTKNGDTTNVSTETLNEVQDNIYFEKY